MNSEPLIDQEARDRFRTEWQRNFAVSANAGSGKTTAISERLAAMALSPEGAVALQKTAVVTYTKKAAAQIGQKARQVLLSRLEAAGIADLGPLDHLERAFFGTIHSFCLLLAQRYGHTHGLNLNPRLLTEDSEEAEIFFEEFLEQDSMVFESLPKAEVDAFLRFVPLEDLFETARKIGTVASQQLARRRPSGPLPRPSRAILDQILSLPVKGTESTRRNLQNNQRAAQRWWERFESGRGFLPLYKPVGTSKAIVELAQNWMAPLKDWLADAAATLTSELAERFRAHRAERGVQTYADQIDVALAVLQDPATLDRIRDDGWRVILDEAQDTDSQQFAVLVEIARPSGAVPGSWPDGGGAPPRDGHFCLVGDGQQAIYRARADIRNFMRHIEAYARGDGGERLVFQVTFRAPRAVIDLLNAGLPQAFGSSRIYNLGLPPEEGAPAPLLQVAYEPLEAGPGNEEGRIEVFPLQTPEKTADGVADRLSEEASQLAEFFASHGPSSVGAINWGEVCVLAPRNDWLPLFQAEFEKAGLKTALQSQRRRSGDSPVYAWLAGLLAVVCHPDNDYEWFGVLREIFAVSDAMLAIERREKGTFQWETPEVHPEPLSTALAIVRPWIMRVDDEGLPLEDFARGLVADCALAEKAAVLDPSGDLSAELDRLLAEAAELGASGAGPREWFKILLAGLDSLRATGKPQDDAINLMTCHSAKGLEWPVVVAAGFWRQIGEAPQRGISLISEGGPKGGARLFLGADSVPSDTVESRQRERFRELVRLLYVTLTRARRRLIIPWDKDFGVSKRKDPSFAEIWGERALLEGLPRTTFSRKPSCEDIDVVPAEEPSPFTQTADSNDEISRPLPILPPRILPHQLAHKTDFSRSLRHESALDQPLPTRLMAGEEAIDYGVWWHETMEHTPWTLTDAKIEAHWADRLVEARARGFQDRAETELRLLRASEAWTQLRSGDWTLLAELAVVAPLGDSGWIDGVMDLVLHNAARREVVVIDWKTNHFRPSERGGELLVRLAREYAPQLSAYGQALLAVMPGQEVRLLVYSSAAGDWLAVEEPKS
ncbi:MAG: UvrD-helicase domain-containing protein [Nibricoccus sp.]